ncbi:MAG: sensor histidine kinase [Candidatus Fimenecus sp.]
MRMRNFLQKYKANLYLVCFVLAAVTVLGGMFLFGSLSLQHDGIRQEDHIFDFSEAVPLAKTHRYYLRGNWEFYYGQLLSEHGNALLSDSLSVPGSWAGSPLHDMPYQSGGYASYRCYVRGLTYDKPLEIAVPNLACAYRVYVDGVLVTQSGTLSKIRGETFTSAAAHKEKVYLDEGTHEIVIEVSADSFSGLYLTPMIADYAYENAYTNALLALRFALIGIIVYASIVLAIFSARSKIRYFSPWLTVLFIALALRMLISTEGYAVSQPLFGNLSYEKMFLFSFASTFIIKLISIIYFRDELKLRVSLQSMALLSVSFLLVVIGVDFLPNSVYTNYYFLVLQLFSTVADLYLINKLCQSLAKGAKNAGLLCCAYMVLLIGITVDALYTCGAMPFRCSSFMPVAFALFALFITIIHARSAMVMYTNAQQAQELERELEKANMAVMISQIQPHFLYNALNTIKSLIRRDPKTAEKAVIDFSYYLRGNMDSLTHTDPIPFRTELQHIQYYCNIELLRFADKLKIEYDIEEDNFTVPTLSIQPLVENAIKHGVTKRPEGGTVKLSTRKDGKNYIVTVADDGVGFNPATALAEDGRSHVGLANIRYRFARMMHAEVTVDSTPSVGTTVTVYIPISTQQKGEE